MSQALLWLYVTDNIQLFRRAGIRGSYEAWDLYRSLVAEKGSAVEQERARDVLNAIAAATSYSPVLLENMLKEVTFDPYTAFLYYSWSGDARPFDEPD